MDASQIESTAWYSELVANIHEELERRHSQRQTTRPNLDAEIEELSSQIQGWKLSLGNPDLDELVRQEIEGCLKQALEDRQHREGERREQTVSENHVQTLVDPQRVARQFDRLAETLASDNPSLGNLEMSMHVDRIDCHPDGRVLVRLCRLGVLADVAELFSEQPDQRPAATTPGADDRKRVKPRRRAKLRIDQWDPKDGDVNVLRQWAANPERFAGLDERWFSVVAFFAPEPPPSWAAENCEAVFRRRQEEKLSYAKLGKEFGVTAPTARAAVQEYLKRHPDAVDEVHLRPGGKRPIKFEVSKFGHEARQLWEAGWSKLKLAEKYHCSTPVIDKALAWSYAKDGLPVPTQTERRKQQVDRARALFDANNSLEEIAEALKVADVTARQLLRESFKAEGKPMPDLRRRGQGAE